MVSMSPVHRERRPRKHYMEDEDEEDTDDSQQSKRRRNDFDERSTSGTPDHSLSGTRPSGNALAGRLNSGSSIGRGEHQPGAIVRVQVTNFVTYEAAVFYPGPNLNMVIGPNGTGKSSLVCAICLGLGYGPKNLGRAQQVGEFVKHGKDEATIEIELQSAPDEARNHVVRVRIARAGDKRKWWIDDNETSLKAVRALTNRFGIQVDNLCQFLPQDRVSEFAGLSPVELLHETQRAAAPQEMLAWHDELKGIRKEEKTLQVQYETDQETMANLEERQENLRGDVERLKERAQIQEKIMLLEKSVPFVEYRVARTQHYDHRHKKAEAQKRLKDLERQVEPTLRAVNAKQEYQNQIDYVVKERKKAVEERERGADLILKKIEDLENGILQVQQTRKAEIDGDKTRRQEMQNVMAKIRDLEARMKNAPPAFDSGDWNARIRERDQRIREIDLELREVTSHETDLRRRGQAVRQKITDAQEEMASLDSQAGQRFNRLKKISADTARAWQWIQDNMATFEKEVYGPPLLTCSVRDPRYTDAIESLFQKNDMLTITTQCMADYKRIHEHVHDVMKLADVSFKSATSSLDAYQPLLPQEDMERLGFDGWALDFLDGPSPVLAALCNDKKLHRTGVALRDVSEQQFDMTVASGIRDWVTGKHSYQVSRRAEYGAGATSTTTRNVGPGKFWTDQPVDAREKRELQERVDNYNQEFDELKAENLDVRKKSQELKTERGPLQEAVEILRRDKNDAQREAASFAALPDKILRETESVERKKQQGTELRQRVAKLTVQEDDLTIKKTNLALKHKTHAENLRVSLEGLLEAEFRLLEATSDVEALRERNAGIAQQLEDERRLVQQVENDAMKAKEIAARALEVCKAIIAEQNADPEYFKSLDPELTMEALQNDIDAEKSKLDYIHEGNSGALKEFEIRQGNIEKLETKLQESEKKLERLSRRIMEVRHKWEPELDKLIGEISDAFSYNFEQIGCAGEVGVHKDDDFDLWSIEIKVKFRENETLQLLDQHRQSGGERSVSTIFYLMSLQSLARAPFRVVDEINQGMDPRNERMVHERMVEIACKEHTSQYFLITPKLLTGLKYDQRMKVLLINSGEYMPSDHTLFTVKQALTIRKAMVAAGNG
ncbi:MAG: Structural maintenance of chromosomes protein 5 [Claussenomyces sp. TS43310]|nr:MAG: Structural maintenance of chromosomes protein 5 [Claussenomyces sp. TS43310]